MSTTIVYVVLEPPRVPCCEKIASAAHSDEMMRQYAATANNKLHSRTTSMKNTYAAERRRPSEMARDTDWAGGYRNHAPLSFSRASAPKG